MVAYAIRFIRLLPALAFFAFNCQAYADASDHCSSTGGSYTASGSRIIQRDMAVGQATDAVNQNGTLYVLNCTASASADRDAYITVKVNSAPVAGYNDVYPTNIDGLGVRYLVTIESDTGCVSVSKKAIPDNGLELTCHVMHSTSPQTGIVSALEFVKIKNVVASGVVTTIPNVNTTYHLNWDNTTNPINDLWSSTVNVAITAVACSLKAQSINVALGNIEATKFNAIGSGVGSNNFTLGLECDPDANINLTMTGAQNGDTGDSSVLALSGAGAAEVASGLGVQILYNDTALKLNENIVLKKSAGGVESLPFVVQYYQTKSIVMPGKADATATFNVTYQ